MKRFLLLIVMMLLTSSAMSFDKGLAGSYEQYFAQFDGKATAKALQFIKMPEFVKNVLTGQKMYILDVRTPNETGMYGLTVPGSHAIPMNQVFKPETLANIPTDQKVVVACVAGHRAMAIATALRHIGFKNVYVLIPGTKGLANHLTPKNAYLRKPKKTAK